MSVGVSSMPVGAYAQRFSGVSSEASSSRRQSVASSPQFGAIDGGICSIPLTCCCGIPLLLGALGAAIWGIRKLLKA
ncbi:MAG: hypothetical protein U0003_02685 [Vampirovibrionales bacterium]